LKKKHIIFWGAAARARARQTAMSSDLERGSGIWENVPLTIRQAFLALNDSALAQGRRIRLLERNADLREDLVKRVLAAVDEKLKAAPPPPQPMTIPSDVERRLAAAEALVGTHDALARRVHELEDAQKRANDHAERLADKVKTLDHAQSELANTRTADQRAEARLGKRCVTQSRARARIGLTRLHACVRLDGVEADLARIEVALADAKRLAAENARHAAEETAKQSMAPLQAAVERAFAAVGDVRARLDALSDAALTADALDGLASVALLEARMGEMEDAVLSAYELRANPPPPPPPPVAKPPSPAKEASPTVRAARREADDLVLRDLLLEVNALRRIVDFELSVGRWIWKGLELAHGGLVPWNVQCVNTAPDIFGWTADSPSVAASEQGLYEVAFGFFVDLDVDVELLVNGELAVASTRNSGAAATGDFRRKGNHSAGNVTGWTYHNFLALPADATLQVRYLPTRGLDEDEAQGFLFLRKL